jgi:CBS domain-containing protein
MKAGEVMTTGAATIRPDATAAEAARLMVEHRISGVPVVDAGGQLVGIVTEGDFLRPEPEARPRLLDILTRTDASARELMARRVEDIMTRDPITAGVETPLDQAVDMMNLHNVKRLPVVAEGKVVGIVSRANLILAMLRKAH